MGNCCTGENAQNQERDPLIDKEKNAQNQERERDKDKEMENEIERIKQRHEDELTRIKQEVNKEKQALLQKVKTLEEELAEWKAKRRVCIMSTSPERLRQVFFTLSNIQLPERVENQVEIVRQKLTDSQSICKADLHHASLVVLVGFPEGHKLLLSDSGPSQLGAAYSLAQSLNVGVFVVYLDKESPKDGEAYHSSLEKLFEKQGMVKDLARQGRFISTKYKEKEHQIRSLNRTQCSLFTKWLEGSLKS